MMTKSILIFVLLVVGGFNLSLKSHWLTNRQSHQQYLQIGSSYSIGAMDKRMLVNALMTGCNKTQILQWQAKFINQTDQGNQKPNYIGVLGEDKAFDRVLITIYPQNVNTNYMVVAFRYSQTFQDLKTDLNFNEIDYDGCSGCKVHKGFYQNWKKMKDYIISNISSISNQFNIKNLYITGISLGAGLAQLSVIDIANNLSNVNFNVVTFAGPRVGNQKWGTKYQQKMRSIDNTRRFVLPNDPIAVQPRQSPNNPLVFFTHTGNNITCIIQSKTCINFGESDQGQHLSLLQKESGLFVQIPAILYAIKTHANNDATEYCTVYNPYPHTKYQLLSPNKYQKPYDFNIHTCDYMLLFKFN